MPVLPDSFVQPKVLSMGWEEYILFSKKALPTLKLHC